jgi:hypothetical protein
MYHPETETTEDISANSRSIYSRDKTTVITAYHPID